MALAKYSMGDLIELTTEINSEGRYGPSDVRGMTISKEIIPTKADVSSTDLSKFLVIYPGEFVFNPRTHGKHIGFGYNNTDSSFIISWNNIGFRVRSEKRQIVLPEYLFLHFSREEWDREACYRSWGSSTEVFSWDALCEMELSLPSLPIQRKYVAVYKAMLDNQKSYERGLKDLEMTCDIYIEDLRRRFPLEKIGPYIEPCDEKNEDNFITLFQGVNVEHEFTEPKRVAEDAENGCIVRTGQFAFNKVMKAHNTKLPIALREGPDCVVSSSYQVFRVRNQEKLLPRYLLMWMNRAETQRYAGFISFGTTRDIFSFADMCEISIPLPDVKIQHAIVDIYNCYIERKRIVTELKQKIKDICPVLLRGSLQDGE